MSRTDLQGVCVCTCSLSQPLGSRVGRAAVQQKKHPAHPVEHTQTQTHTHTVKYT